MNTIKRLGYFLFGLSIGIVILSFIFSAKKTSCNYGPQARVKDQLLSKQIILAKSTPKLNLSENAIKEFIYKSKVDFSLSDTKKDSCKTYVLKGWFSSKKTSIEFENCLKTVYVLKVNF